MIYQYVFRFKNPIKFSWYAMFLREERQKSGQIKPDETLKVVRICKQIYHEALPIYFRANTFKFDNVKAMGSFLKGIGGERRNLITDISFEYCGLKLNDAFALLQECANLKKLHVDTSYETLARARGGQKDLCTANGLKSLLKVRGCKDVTTTHRTHPSWDHIAQESIEKFRNLLTTELCKGRKQPKKRKPKEQGKKALLAASKAVKGKEGGSGTGCVV
jgi:hypothetical protein